MTNSVQTHFQDQIATITMQLDQNRFSPRLLKDIKREIEHYGSLDDCRGVIIAGNHPKYFSTGLDLDWAKTATKSELSQFLYDMHDFLVATLRFPKPLIGCLRGHTFGFAAIWSCAFDFRFMSDGKGFFCFPEVEIPFEVAQTLQFCIDLALSKAAQKNLILQAKRLSAQDAFQVGLVENPVPIDTIEEKCIEFAIMLGQKNLSNYARTKERLHGDTIFRLGYAMECGFENLSWADYFQSQKESS